MLPFKKNGKYKTEKKKQKTKLRLACLKTLRLAEVCNTFEEKKPSMKTRLNKLLQLITSSSSSINQSHLHLFYCFYIKIQTQVHKLIYSVFLAFLLFYFVFNHLFILFFKNIFLFSLSFTFFFSPFSFLFSFLFSFSFYINID